MAELCVRAPRGLRAYLKAWDTFVIPMTESKRKPQMKEVNCEIRKTQKRWQIQEGPELPTAPRAGRSTPSGSPSRAADPSSSLLNLSLTRSSEFRHGHKLGFVPMRCS